VIRRAAAVLVTSAATASLGTATVWALTPGASRPLPRHAAAPPHHRHFAAARHDRR